MAKDIELKKADRDIFADQGSSWMALDLPEIKPPMYSKAFILFLSGFIVTGTLYSAVTTVPVVVESSGKLATSKPAIPVRSNLNFTVNAIRVKENQVVKAGDLLVSSDRGLVPEQLALVRDLEANLNFIAEQPPGQCANCEKAVRQIMTITAKLSKHKIAGMILRPVAVSSKVMSETFSQINELEKKMNPIKTRLASLSQAGSRQPASAAKASAQEIKKLQGQMKQFQTLQQTTIEKSRQYLLNESQQIWPHFQELSKISGVTSPVEGKIVNIRLKGEGESIGNGQPVMEIIPTDNDIIASIEVLNKDIASVRVGDPVEIAVDAYPEMDFGVLNGTISEILPTDGSEPTNPMGFDHGFKVRVKLESQKLHAGGVDHDLLPGMTIRARTIKKNETLLKKFYRSIFRVKEDLRAQKT